VHPGEITAHPATGFQVLSVHSIDVSAIVTLFGRRESRITRSVASAAYRDFTAIFGRRTGTRLSAVDGCWLQSSVRDGKWQKAHVGASPSGVLDGRALVAAARAPRALAQHIARRAGAPADDGGRARERRAVFPPLAVESEPRGSRGGGRRGRDLWRLSSDYSEIKIRLKFAPDAPAPNFALDWSKPPTEPMLVAIRSVDGKRAPRMMKWGLTPHWAKDDKLQFSTFKARAEDFATKPSFRDVCKWDHRCLVLTDGFYEWKKLDPKGKHKQPYAIAMADDEQMVMAGIWAKWKSPKGEEVLSCTVLTCEPNKLISELHYRMPVILPEGEWPKWLGEEPATEDELLAMLKPCADESLKMWPVDRMVGNVKNNGAQLLTPAQEARLV
jgi:putative SOS response-associated peptidase YedK